MSDHTEQRVTNGNMIRKTASAAPSQDAADIIWRLHSIKKLSLRNIAAETGKSLGQVCRIIQRRDPITGVQKVVNFGRPFKSTTESDTILRDLALGNPYVGIRGLAGLYNETAETKLCPSSIGRRLDRIGIRCVAVRADTEETEDRKRFPKSQFVWKFEAVPVKAEKQRMGKKPIDTEGREPTDSSVRPKKRRSWTEKMPLSFEFDHNLMCPETGASQEAEQILASKLKKKSTAKTKQCDAELLQTTDSADTDFAQKCASVPVQSAPDDTLMDSEYESMSGSSTPAAVATTGSPIAGTVGRKKYKVISQDAVDIILRLRQVNKLSLRQIGERTGKSRTCVHRILRRCDPVSGIYKALPMGRPLKTAEDTDQTLRAMALANPYVGLLNLAALYNETAETKQCASNISRRLNRVGVRSVQLPAHVEEVREQRRFPKSQFVWKFEEIPVKVEKQRNPRRKSVYTEDPESADLPAKAKKRKAVATVKKPIHSDDDMGLVPLPRVMPIEDDEEVMAIMAIPLEPYLLPLLPES